MTKTCRNLMRMTEVLRSDNLTVVFRHVSPASLLVDSADIDYQRALVHESETIRNFKRVKFSHDPQECCRYQDERTDWPSVVREL
jgi:hypothetical protein